MTTRTAAYSALAACFCLLPTILAPAQDDTVAVDKQAERWRAEHRLIDMHQHIDPTPERLARAVKITDAVGIGIAIDLGVGTVTPGPNREPSQLEQAKKLTAETHP